MSSVAQLLEHVNLNIEDEETSKKFYCDLLGFTFNAKSSAAVDIEGNRRQLHVNCGISQLHLLFRNVDASPIAEAQLLSGRLGVAVESLQAVQDRLECSGEWDFVRDYEAGEPCLSVSGPSGNQLCLVEAKMSRDEVVAIGGHHGGIGEAIAMPFVELDCQPGTTVGIANFYREILCPGSEAVVRPEEALCVVSIGREGVLQELRFVERNEAPSREDYVERASKAYHLALYVTDFKGAYDRCAEKGLVWVNPRFPSDSAATWHEAEEQQQFRVLRVTDPETDELCLMLEHEVRSLQHPSCPIKRAP